MIVFFVVTRQNCDADLRCALCDSLKCDVRAAKHGLKVPLHDTPRIIGRLVVRSITGRLQVQGSNTVALS